MSLLDDYKKQVNSYDAGKPNTPMPSRGKTGTGVSNQPSQFAQDVSGVFKKAVDSTKNMMQSRVDNEVDQANSSFGVARKVGDYLFGTSDATLSDEGKRLGALANASTFRRNPGALQSSSSTGSGSTSTSASTSSPNTQPSQSAALAQAQESSPKKYMSGLGTMTVGGVTHDIGVDPFKGLVKVGPDNKMQAVKGTLFGKEGATPNVTGQQGTGGAKASIGGNYTGAFGMDEGLFKARMAALDRGEKLDPEFYRKYGVDGGPGGGTYQQGSIMDKLSTQRDSLFRQVSEMDRTSGISRDSSIGDIIAHKLKTKGMRDEIDRIDKEVLGRTDFANKIQTQLLQNIGAQALQGMKEAGDTSRNNLNNAMAWDISKMREAAETGRKIFETNAATGSAAAKLDAEAAKAEHQRRDDIFMELMRANTDAMKAGNGPLDIKAAVQATRGLYDEYYGKPGKKSAIDTIK